MMADIPIPKCTRTPERCALCDIISQIFDGFSTETDPGCEEGHSTAQKEEGDNAGTGHGS